MSSGTLLERRYRVFATHAPLFYDRPVHIARSGGVYLYDADGTQYLDAYNNVPHVGHCHPRVVHAICEQARTLNTHTRYINEVTIRYAERLTAQFAPSLSKAIFCCSGSEANEIALRMARLCTGGEGIIVSAFTYHGNTTAVLEVSNAFETGVPPSRRVRTIPLMDPYRDAGGRDPITLARDYARNVESEIEGFRQDGIRIAGLLLCTAMASEGLPDMPSGFLEQAVRAVHQAGGVFIADEVQAGFGRLGSRMWGHEVLGAVPDIVSMGKPMGNGHPLAGVVARAELVEEFAKRSAYFNTFGGNPVSCAAGAAVLDVLEDEHLIENAVGVGAYTRRGLRELQDKHQIIGDVRGNGLFIGVDLVKDRTSKEPAGETARAVVNKMRERGVLISRTGPKDNVLKIRPPMPFARANSDQLLETLDHVLEDL